jgi:DNA-directed RNA polymerase subunit M/transcription elongation factor TFIIS
MRKLGKTCLSQVLTNKKHINTLEKAIFILSKKDETVYKQILYEIATKLIHNKSMQNIAKIMKKQKYGFNDHTFDQVKKILKEEDDFVENPFEVSEGVLTCKCGSNKTMSYPMQTRSSDEKTSVFVCCVKCGKKWVE